MSKKLTRVNIIIYKTIQDVKEREIEGSYLLDLEIHFSHNGKVIGSGSTQYVTSSEYFSRLDPRWR